MAMLGLALAPTLAGSYLAIRLWPSGPEPVPAEVSLAMLTLLAGAILAIIVLVRYLLDPFQKMAAARAEMQMLYYEARQDSLADGLTGLGNHRAFREALERGIESYEERRRSFSLVLIDLDDLKVVNDRDGHAAGDEMLRALARTMRDLSRHGDLLYRTGGDEFAMLLFDTDIDEATSVAERLLHFCKRPADGGRPFAFCGGISGVPYFGRQRDLVYRQADAALYWAKRHGRGSIEVFDAQRDQMPDEFDNASGNAVAEVILDKLLRPVFQPIVDLRSGRIIGFEGLIRPDPKGPLPDTAQLFAAAAASGRTVELDLACIEAVVQGARAIGSDRLLTLNLSPRTLEVKDFDAAWLLQGLVRNGISPSRVIIEMTERDEVDDIGRLRQTFAALQQYGLRLAADDVGAGNAGLRLLSQVQFDIVKIDLSLVQDGVRRLGARTVLQSLRDLALSQDARIVAEGVETAEQLHVIRELQIGAGQGFLLGRPEVSVAKTFVDVRQLETGVLIPVMEAPAGAWPSAAAVVRADDAEAISDERRAIFLPPARRRLGAEAVSA
jgi:diguanylate cyclase (GGDEF)-like protein